MHCSFCSLDFEEVLNGHMTIENELVQYYGTYTDEDRQEEESDSGDDADDRFAAYEAALEAATRPAPPKKITVRRTGNTVRKGKGDIMFEERVASVNVRNMKVDAIVWKSFAGQKYGF